MPVAFTGARLMSSNLSVSPATLTNVASLSQSSQLLSEMFPWWEVGTCYIRVPSWLSPVGSLVGFPGTLPFANRVFFGGWPNHNDGWVYLVRSLSLLVDYLMRVLLAQFLLFLFRPCWLMLLTVAFGWFQPTRVMSSCAPHHTFVGLSSWQRTQSVAEDKTGMSTASSGIDATLTTGIIQIY